MSDASLGHPSPNTPEPSSDTVRRAIESAIDRFQQDFSVDLREPAGETRASEADQELHADQPRGDPRVPNAEVWFWRGQGAAPPASAEPPDREVPPLSPIDWASAPSDHVLHPRRRGWRDVLPFLGLIGILLLAAFYVGFLSRSLDPAVDDVLEDSPVDVFDQAGAESSSNQSSAPQAGDGPSGVSPQSVTPAGADQPAAAAPDPPTAGEVVERLAVEEASLRSGIFDAVVDYSDGTQATAHFIFDMGDATLPPSLYSKTVYNSAQGTQVLERISIGEQAWERRGDGEWAAAQELEGVWGRIQPYLPQAANAVRPEFVEAEGGPTLHWSDAARDVTVLLDLESGIPREERVLSEPSGSTLVVTYQGWNIPVEISAPVGP